MVGRAVFCFFHYVIMLILFFFIIAVVLFINSPNCLKLSLLFIVFINKDVFQKKKVVMARAHGASGPGFDSPWTDIFSEVQLRLGYLSLTMVSKQNGGPWLGPATRGNQDGCPQPGARIETRNQGARIETRNYGGPRWPPATMGVPYYYSLRKWIE